MTDLSAHAILARNKTSLKETSCNDQSPNNPYMTNSSLEVINFDAVKTEYVDSLHLSEVPKSNDALLQKKDGSLVFVEFKGGQLNQRLLYDLRKKIYDSILILGDILGETISHTRMNLDYVLVHSDKAFGTPPSLDYIVKSVAENANEKHIKGGLNAFKSYCFREVATLTTDEFEEYLKTKFSETR